MSPSRIGNLIHGNVCNERKKKMEKKKRNYQEATKKRNKIAKTVIFERKKN